jgi:peroxiredoxin/outer membrane lipoprotein-sorting protein
MPDYRNRCAPIGALVAALGLALLAASSLARAAEAPDGRALLDDVARTYRGLASFHFAGSVAMTMSRQGTHESFDLPLVLAAAKPGRWRIGMDSPTMGVVRVTDGKTEITYSQPAGQYTRSSVPAKRSSGTDSAEVMAGPGSPIARYYGISRALKSARWIGTRTLERNGAGAECDLVAAEYERPASPGTEYSPTMYWIERGRSVVLRESTHVHGLQPDQSTVDLDQTTTFTTARINEKLPDSLFSFRPPAGATEVASFGKSNAPDLSGKKAEDFTLDDLDGKPVKLSSLRGKVVLLDFWATWCGPCRIEMPNIQKLHREFKSRGLVVLGINYGEDAERVRPFLEKNGYDFRILLDRVKSVGERYQVGGIPALFIIDKTGTIRAHFVGVRDEDTLREALARVGLKSRPTAAP